MALPQRRRPDREDAQPHRWWGGSRGASGIAVACVALGIVAFWIYRIFLPTADSGRVASDLHTYYYPLYEMTAEWMAAGRAPLWNPYHLAGLPWLATAQVGALYPPHVLYLLLPTPYALAASGLLHLLLAGVCTGWLLRRVGLGTAAAVLGALWFALSRAQLGWLRYPSALEAGAWLPLGCVGVVLLCQGRRSRGALLLALAMAFSTLAGFVQATVFCGATWATLLLALLVFPARGARVVQAFAAAGAVMLGLLLAAPQLLPTLELTREGTRATEALAPELLRGGGDFWSLDAVSPVSGSLRLVALLLAPLALLRPRRALALWALTIWALTLALVTYLLASPEGVEFYRRLPVVGWFAVPKRLLLLTNLGIAVAAALGFDAVRGRIAEWSPRAAHGFVAAVVLVALTEIALGPAIYRRLPYRLDDADDHRVHAALFEQLRPLVGEDRIASVFFRPSPELLLAARYELRWLGGSEPMTLRRHSEYFGYLQRGTLEDTGRVFHFSGRVFPGSRTSLLRPPLAELRSLLERRRLLDLASMRWLLTGRAIERIPELERLFTRVGWRKQAVPDWPYVLFENPDAVPRAFVTYRGLPAPEPARLLEALASDGFDPLAASYIERPAGFAPHVTAPVRGHPARIVRDEATRVEIEAELAAPGLVVLGDAFAAGWSAEVDGEPAEILAANHLFRAVAVHAGRHVVRFDYRAPGLATGLWLAALGCCGIAGTVALGIRARRRSPIAAV